MRLCEAHKVCRFPSWSAGVPARLKATEDGRGPVPLQLLHERGAGLKRYPEFLRLFLITSAAGVITNFVGISELERLLHRRSFSSDPFHPIPDCDPRTE
jgi:hypothetical protein